MDYLNPARRPHLVLIQNLNNKTKKKLVVLVDFAI